MGITPSFFSKENTNLDKKEALDLKFTVIVINPVKATSQFQRTFIVPQRPLSVKADTAVVSVSCYHANN